MKLRKINKSILHFIVHLKMYDFLTLEMLAMALALSFVQNTKPPIHFTWSFREGFKKKIWNFPDLVWPTPPTLVIAKNLEKKIMLLKCFLSNFETFFLTPYQIESFKWLKMQGIDLNFWVDRPCPGDSKKVWHLYVCLKISAVDLDNPIN